MSVEPLSTSAVCDEGANALSLRVGYVSPTSEIGGAEVSLLGLLRHLKPELAAAVVFCPRPGRLTERLSAIPCDWEVQRVGELSRKHLLRFWLDVRGLARAARRHRLNLLHANSVYVAEATFLAARMIGAKVVCHVRDLCPVLGARWLRRYAFNHADCVVAISAAVQKDLVKQLHVRPSVIRVVHNGVDLSEFDPERPGRRDFFAGTAIERLRRVGVVGRLSPEKGHECFLNAAAEIARKEPGVGFAIVGDAALGDGEYAKRLVARARELGLTERTLFTGFKDGVADVLASLDVVVVPSEAEPFGRVTIEAMASARPVVATCTGGTPEIVTDGETGVLVGPRDPVALAEATLLLVRDHDLASQMGMNGRRRAQERFSIEEHGRHVTELYSSLLRGAS